MKGSGMIGAEELVAACVEINTNCPYPLVDPVGFNQIDADADCNICYPVQAASLDVVWELRSMVTGERNEHMRNEHL
jgi:hypothetical protein